jgi:hypothetical protein
LNPDRKQFSKDFSFFLNTSWFCHNTIGSCQNSNNIRKAVPKYLQMFYQKRYEKMNFWRNQKAIFGDP